MCVISMIYDHYNPAWPKPSITPIETAPPWQFQLTPAQEVSALQAFEELCEAAKKLDAILGLPDCEDPKKAEWLNEVRERVRQHELDKINQRLEK